MGVKEGQLGLPLGWGFLIPPALEAEGIPPSPTESEI